MSKTMRHFLGGMMTYSRELAIFWAWNVNSYKRYAVASWAPVNVVWGRDNRTTGFRVVGDGPALHVEDRFPGGDMNSYTTYAAVVGAGLLGIEREIEPPAEYIGNGYVATGCDRMPRALHEAIRELEASEAAAEIFGPTSWPTTSTRRASSRRRTTPSCIPGTASDTWSEADATRRLRTRWRSSPAPAAAWAAWRRSSSPAEGAKVVVAEFDEAAGNETVESVQEAGGEATFVRTDVSQEADAKAMVDHAVATYGRVDVLYNNAGVMPEPDHSVIDTDVATWDKVMAVNVRGVFLGCKYAIPQMLEQGSGSVINISSFVALLGCSVPQDAYTASKGAVLSLTRSLAVQFGPRGVRSNAICPGPIETPLLMDWLLKDEAAKQLRLARNPTGRFGKPEEIVNAALYLASDESRWTNGASLRDRRRHQRQLLLSRCRRARARR